MGFQGVFEGRRPVERYWSGPGGSKCVRDTLLLVFVMMRLGRTAGVSGTGFEETAGEGFGAGCVADLSTLSSISALASRIGLGIRMITYVQAKRSISVRMHIHEHRIFFPVEIERRGVRPTSSSKRLWLVVRSSKLRVQHRGYFTNVFFVEVDGDKREFRAVLGVETLFGEGELGEVSS